MSKINETNYPRRTQANYADTDMLVIQAAGGNTCTTRLEDMREDYEKTLAPTLSALQDDVNENFATIEAGSTASKAYAKGDFLVFGGRLCKAKTSIASGATLVLDTNIELDSVGDELSSISSDLANKGTFAHRGIYAGYVTASKNYINFFVPMDLAHGASNPSVNVAITSLSAYIGTSRLSFAGYFDTSYISVNVYKYGITVEIKFLSTYSVEAPVSVYADLNITVS